MDLVSNVDAALLTEISKESFHPIGIVRIDWPGDLIEAHTGAGDISFDSGTFTGTLIGDVSMATINVPAELSGLRATEISLTLYGPYAELLDRLDAGATGRNVFLWAGATTEPGGNVLVGTPRLVFTGAISGDALPAPSPDDSSGLIIRAKSGTHGRVKGAISHSDEEQQSVYPGDNYFERNGRASAYRALQPYW
jgi:hypothetical protein